MVSNFTFNADNSFSLSLDGQGTGRAGQLLGTNDGSRLAYVNPIQPIQPSTPAGGRITLTSNTPVLSANTTNQSTLYYTPYISNQVSFFNANTGSWVGYTFTQQSIVLDATNVANNGLYDVYVFLNANTPLLGYSPAWTNTSTRTASIAITQAIGAWTNLNTVTLRANSTQTYSVSNNQGLYLGSFYATSAGNTGVIFTSAAAGGGNAIVGIFNAYNQVPIAVHQHDTTGSWTYGTNTWRASDGSNKNSISYVDGLGNITPSATFRTAGSGASEVAAIGINLNSNTATPSSQALIYDSESLQATVTTGFAPILGFNTIYGMETAPASSTLYGTGFTGGIGAVQGLDALLLY